MKKYSDLLKNIGILTLGNFGSKFLSFFLVPLYTAVLTTKEYGNFDFIYITISLLIPLLTINIAEASTRFLLDKDKSFQDKRTICIISNKYVVRSCIIVAIFTIFNYIFGFIGVLKEFSVFFLLLYITMAYSTLLQNIMRGYNKLSVISISGIINSVFMLSLNILFLLVFKMGLYGYFLAYIIANIIMLVYLYFQYRKCINNCLVLYDKKTENELVQYSKPLMLNSIGWWVNNVSDRYVVTYICGIAANGIYSVAYKIPSILTIFQSIFNQAWTISAVKEFDSEENVFFVRHVYSLYSVSMIIICSIFIITSKALARVLYLNEFYDAWRYMPFLMISVVFGALSGFLGAIFSAVKDSKTMGWSTLIGSIINIVFNIILVYFIGPIGAAISTAFSYGIVWIVRVLVLKKNYSINLIFIKDILSILILVMQSIVILFVSDNLYLYIFELILLLILLLIYNRFIINIIKRMFLIMFKKRNKESII